MDLKRLMRRKAPTTDEQQPALATTGIDALEAEINATDILHEVRGAALTPHDIYLLRASGYAPMQIVFGNVVYSMGIGGVVRTVRRAMKRGEVPDFTRMMNDARLLARNRMLQAARALGAEDVVGVEFEITHFADFIEITATGTAVAKVGEFALVPAAVGA